MSKKSDFDWLPKKEDDDDPYDFSNVETIDFFGDDEESEDDESYAAEDYYSSRPWGKDNDGW